MALDDKDIYWIDDNGINRIGRPPITEQELYEAAQVSKNQSDMGRFLKCDRSTIIYNLRKYNIKSKIHIILLQNKLKAEVENISGANNNE